MAQEIAHTNKPVMFLWVFSNQISLVWLNQTGSLLDSFNQIRTQKNIVGYRPKMAQRPFRDSGPIGCGSNMFQPWSDPTTRCTVQVGAKWLQQPGTLCILGCGWVKSNQQLLAASRRMTWAGNNVCCLPVIWANSSFFRTFFLCLLSYSRLRHT